MRTTGPVVDVRALEARLSAYLRDVRQGSAVTIGDRRRRPVACLAPFDRSMDRDEFAGFDDRLARAAARERLPLAPR